LKDRSRQVFV